MIQPNIIFIKADKQSEIQRKLSNPLTYAFTLKTFWECAKPAAEIAIEQDGQTAIDWLESVS